MNTGTSEQVEADYPVESYRLLPVESLKVGDVFCLINAGGTLHTTEAFELRKNHVAVQSDRSHLRIPRVSLVLLKT